jgi:hypothetical protein
MFNVNINAVCDSDCTCSYVLLADVFKFLHNIGHVEDCKPLQLHFDAVQKWFWENGRKVNVDKITFIFFTRMSNSIHFLYMFFWVFPPKEYIQDSEHGENLKSRVYTSLVNYIVHVLLVNIVYKTCIHF